MMAYYFRKQEEDKKLLENDEDDYLNSTWADTKSLKKYLFIYIISFILPFL